jgi:hypothetical protein
MASELLGERFTVLTNIPPVEFLSVDHTTNFIQDAGLGDPAMNVAVAVGMARMGAFAMSSFPVFVDAADASRLPVSSDPPFPPVYPYFFSTAQIYGRENMNNVIRFVRGDTYTFDGEIELGGVALNLTGASITMTAKWSLKDSSSVFQLTESSGITITDAAAGAITVVIPPSATTGLPDVETVLKYDIEVVTSGSSVYTVARGELIIFPDATI